MLASTAWVACAIVALAFPITLVAAGAEISADVERGVFHSKPGAGGFGSQARDVVNFDFAWRFRLSTSPQTDVEGTVNGKPTEEALPGFDDSDWEVIDAPHDMLIGGTYASTNNKAQAFLPRGCGWYRKHFSLPSEWQGSAVWIYFEGIFHETVMWLNGQRLGLHNAGYTSFWYRLDDSGAKYGSGPSNVNVLAVSVNASSGTGWWYEGGGLARHQYLVRANPVFLPPHRSWAYADMADSRIVSNGAAPVDGLSASGVAFAVEAVVKNAQARTLQDVSLAATFYAGAETVGIMDAKLVSLAPGAEQTFRIRMPITRSIQLWSVARPFLHTASLAVKVAGVTTDEQNITFGARSIRFDADTGLWLNERRTKLRGFCDHSNFGGVGSAVPDRLNLFRAQALRVVGSNAWRMAHNPPVPIRLDMMDRLGMLAMDETRDYGGKKGQGGNTSEDVAQELQDMADLVQRDRSHASVIIWSFCNEVGCMNESAAVDFRNMTYTHDQTRPVTQNHLGLGKHPLSMASLDVQGMSHEKGDVMDEFHKHNPTKPLVSSECCSCMSQRGVDQDFCPSPKDGGDDHCHDSRGQGGSSGIFYNNEIAECTAEQVAWSDLRDFNSGTFLWSGFDYLGESRGWPQTTKCRGAVADVAGFEKESRWWLRSWWLSNISEADHGRPVLWPGAVAAEAATTLYIVESWVPAPGSKTRTVHVYTDAPAVRLWLNGKLIGDSVRVPLLGSATFANVSFAGGNLTAEALASFPSGARLASYSRHTTGPASRLRLSLDAPSPRTGTGEALVADGEDVAMVRVELVDDAGRLVAQHASAFSNVSFRVLSGAGRLLAVHSGGPADHSAPAASSAEAYHGLVRAFIRSTEDRSTTERHRRLLRRIDIDSGRQGSSRIVDPADDEGGNTALPPIVLQASVEGLPAATISIPLTRDLSMLPLAVAAASAVQEPHVGPPLAFI